MPIAAALDGSDAYTIWLRARSAVTRATYPARIDYTIAVSGLDGARPTLDHYRASCDPGYRAIRVFPISEEQLAQAPPVPHGFDFSFKIALSTGRLAPAIATIPAGRPAPASDLLGVPLLEPTYTFGLRYRSQIKGSSDAAPPPLPVIAIVSAQTADYRIALIDAPAIDGIPTYHLKLTPLRRPKDNRLRELWVGSNDYLPRKAVVSGNFTIRPLVDVPWTIDFAVRDGAPYIASESAAATLYMEHRRVVRHAVIAFEDVGEPSETIYDKPLVTPEATDTASTLTEPGI
ncbi:MAG TPA: hypothetical protein VMT95_14480 [Candidatus Binatia bacterium]|nr:hypothetical protein [Candidatus Binatia bacterium]